MASRKAIASRLAEASGSSDRGESLVEVLIAMVITGICVVALLAGLASGTFSSAVHRQQTVAGTVLESAGEAIANSAYNPYVDCATASSYNPVAGMTLDSGWVVSINDVQWWNGSSFESAGSSPCPDTSSDDYLHLQLVDVTVAGPGGRVTEARAYVKRGP